MYVFVATDEARSIRDLLACPEVVQHDWNIVSLNEQHGDIAKGATAKKNAEQKSCTSPNMHEQVVTSLCRILSAICSEMTFLEGDHSCVSEVVNLLLLLAYNSARNELPGINTVGFPRCSFVFPWLYHVFPLLSYVVLCCSCVFLCFS